MADKKRSSAFGNVIAHGVDHVEIADFARVLSNDSPELLGRYFTKAELNAVGTGANRLKKLASRFAIKEAVLKALTTGWGGGVAFTDVEVLSLPQGAPAIVLHRKLVEVAAEHGIGRWLVSASHTESTAMASVIAIASD